MEEPEKQAQPPLLTALIDHDTATCEVDFLSAYELPGNSELVSLALEASPWAPHAFDSTEAKSQDKLDIISPSLLTKSPLSYRNTTGPKFDLDLDPAFGHLTAFDGATFWNSGLGSGDTKTETTGIHSGTVNSCVLDSTAATFCTSWLDLYPERYPSSTEIDALSKLTHQHSELIQQWLACKLRSGLTSSRDSGIGSSKASAASCAGATKQDLPGNVSNRAEISAFPNTAEARIFDATLTGLASVADFCDVEKHVAFDSAPSSPPVDGFSRLVVPISTSWTKTPTVSESLLHAAWTSRARISCHPTPSSTRLQRNPGKPLQCTRACGYSTAAKKDWKRHEENAFPRHGWVCTVPAAVKVNGVLYCSYCPPDHKTVDPTVEHMKSAHGMTFQSSYDMENDVCNQICHRKEHMENHFKKIHPGLHPDAWIEIGAFKVKHSEFPRHCGFCSTTFESWNERINHIHDHFERDGVDMQQWWERPHSDHRQQGKRPRRDEDPDDNGDDGDGSNGDDDDDDYKGSGNAEKCSGAHCHEPKRQKQADRYTKKHDTPGCELYDQGSNSEEDRSLPLKRVFDWLDDIPELDTVNEAYVDATTMAHPPRTGHGDTQYWECLLDYRRKTKLKVSSSTIASFLKDDDDHRSPVHVGLIGIVCKSISPGHVRHCIGTAVKRRAAWLDNRQQGQRGNHRLRSGLDASELCLLLKEPVSKTSHI